MSATSQGGLDLLSHSSLYTERLGERLGAAARPGDVFTLRGELGTGKTVFVRGLARGMGLGGPVSSPTFVLVNEYDGQVPLYHIDFYRLDAPLLPSVGWEEFLELGGVVAIEWPERAEALLPDERLDVRFEHVSDSKRRVRLEPHGTRAAELLKVVGDAVGD